MRGTRGCVLGEGNTNVRGLCEDNGPLLLPCLHHWHYCLDSAHCEGERKHCLFCMAYEDRPALPLFPPLSLCSVSPVFLCNVHLLGLQDIAHTHKKDLRKELWGDRRDYRRKSLRCAFPAFISGWAWIQKLHEEEERKIWFVNQSLTISITTLSCTCSCLLHLQSTSQCLLLTVVVDGLLVTQSVSWRIWPTHWMNTFLFIQQNPEPTASEV